MSEQNKHRKICLLLHLHYSVSQIHINPEKNTKKHQNDFFRCRLGLPNPGTDNDRPGRANSFAKKSPNFIPHTPVAVSLTGSVESPLSRSLSLKETNTGIRSFRPLTCSAPSRSASYPFGPLIYNASPGLSVTESAWSERYPLGPLPWYVHTAVGLLLLHWTARHNFKWLKTTCLNSLGICS